MGQCPFCSAPVDAALIVHGGPCPHCFNEIPGEEAATDPGAARQAEERAAAAAKAKRAQGITIAVVALLLAAAGGTYAYYAKKKADEEAILYVEFDEDMDIFSIDDADWEELYGEPKPEVVEEPTARPETRRAPPSGTSVPDEEVEELSFDALEDKANKALRDAKEDPSGSASEPGARAEPRPSLAPPPPGERLNADVTLRTDAEIKRHIGLMMKVYGGRVKRCYDKALNDNADFSGKFTLQYVVQKDGTTRDVAVTGPGLEPSFERCMVEDVGTWTFNKLSKEAPVTYPLTLRQGM